MTRIVTRTIIIAKKTKVDLNCNGFASPLFSREKRSLTERIAAAEMTIRSGKGINWRKVRRVI